MPSPTLVPLKAWHKDDFSHAHAWQWCRCRHMAYVSLVLDDYDESEPPGTSDEGHYRCLSCALADASCGPSAVVMVRADLSELEGCAHDFEGACLDPPGPPLALPSQALVCACTIHLRLCFCSCGPLSLQGTAANKPSNLKPFSLISGDGCRTWIRRLYTAKHPCPWQNQWP